MTEIQLLYILFPVSQFDNVIVIFSRKQLRKDNSFIGGQRKEQKQSRGSNLARVAMGTFQGFQGEGVEMAHMGTS